MLRSCLKNVRFGYNNFNNWRRYFKNYPIQSETKLWKKEFKEGDQAEFSYDNKVAWPEDYKPWRDSRPFEYVLGLALIILYFDQRTDRIRENDGITESHPYPV